MDSLTVVTEQVGTISLLMSGVIMGLVIMPLVQVLKRLLFFKDVEARYLVAALSIIAVAILSRFIDPTMTVAEIINKGLAAVGTATLTHLGYQKVKKIKNNNP